MQLTSKLKDLSEKYDVIVVGGGPAGLAAAIYASKYGASTLLIERKEEIGVPVQCGEFLPSRTEIHDILPHAEHIKLLIEYPSNIKLNQTSRIEIYSPSCRKYTTSFNGIVIDREKYDKWLAELAIKNGADIAVRTKVIKTKNSKVEILGASLDQKMIQYEILIVAAGASSIFRSLILNQITDYDVSYAYQWVMDNLDLDPNTIYMFSGLKYSPGAYGWIIPRGGDEANIGVGVRKPYMQKGIGIKKYLENLVYNHPVVSKIASEALILSKIGGVIPVGPPPYSAIKNNMIFTGDIANMVIASIGAGVPTAVISGTIAGEISAKVINNEDLDIRDFDNLWKKEIGEELLRGYEIRKMMDPFLKSDKLIELALAVLGEKYLSEIIRARIPNFIYYLYKMYGKFIY